MHVKLIVYIAVLRERGCYESMPNSIGETLVGQKKLTKKGGTSLHYVYETVAPTNNKFPSANKHVGLFFSTKTFVAAARRKKKSQSSFVSAFRIAFVLSPHHFE